MSTSALPASIPFARRFSRVRVACLLALTLSSPLLATSAAAASDPVLDWMAITNDTVLSTGTNSLLTSRVVSLVSASVFDAVNGIDRQYRPLHVAPNAPHHASAEAAAIQAAFVILVDLYPALSPPLTTQRDTSIAALASTQSPRSIQAGMAWGQTVADAIWSWRSADGFAPPPPPFLGALGIVGTPAAIGVWRPTPPTNTSAVSPQFASTTPWVLLRPSQFRIAPPYALSSPEYAADYNETKTMGSLNSSSRTADQTELALFWNGNTPLFWVRIASQIASARSMTLSENAHLFALLNVSMADAAFACWDSKFRYVFWRPITAIRSGDIDGNDATDLDAAWNPLLNFFASGTPSHPEYPSAHSSLSGSAATVLASIFGDNTPFTLTSDVRSGTRTFPSFSYATAEVADARVFGGIHFRTSCLRGLALGNEVANFVLGNAMRPTHGDREGGDRD